MLTVAEERVDDVARRQRDAAPHDVEHEGHDDAERDEEEEDRVTCAHGLL